MHESGTRHQDNHDLRNGWPWQISKREVVMQQHDQVNYDQF